MSETNIYFKKFCENLALLGLTYDEVKRDYKYSGGTKGAHKNYFDLCFPMDNNPKKEELCLCEHPIVDNCYLSKGFDINTILIVGNCCIKNLLINHLELVFIVAHLIRIDYLTIVMIVRNMLNAVILRNAYHVIHLVKD